MDKFEDFDRIRETFYILERDTFNRYRLDSVPTYSLVVGNKYLLFLLAPRTSFMSTPIILERVYVGSQIRRMDAGIDSFKFKGELGIVEFYKNKEYTESWYVRKYR